MTKNQIVAFIVGVAICLGLFLLGMFYQAAGDTLGPILQYASPGYQFQKISRGVIELRNAVYHLSFIAVLLIVSTRVLRIAEVEIAVATIKKSRRQPGRKGRAALEAPLGNATRRSSRALILINVVSCQSRASSILTLRGRFTTCRRRPRRSSAACPRRSSSRPTSAMSPPSNREAELRRFAPRQQFADASNGKVDYERIDPWSNPELQAELKKEGIDKLRLHPARCAPTPFEQVPMYFHVVFSHLDKRRSGRRRATSRSKGWSTSSSRASSASARGKKKVGITIGYGEPPQPRRSRRPARRRDARRVKIGLGDTYDVTGLRLVERSRNRSTAWMSSS